MRGLHIDIETYSSQDLLKVGVYRYVEAPDFKVLLFGYCFDDQDCPAVADIDHGEALPPEVLQAMADPSIIKWAHNANFERVCLAKHFGLPMDPAPWRCTQAWARALALPASLGPLSALILGQEEQKDKAGKKLIDKFCTLQGRAQLDLFDSDWQNFIEYCRQDVVAEMAVHRWLQKYPMTDFEWSLWHLDQHINDIGLPMDMELIEAIRRMDAELREKLIQDLKQITGCPNPNSRDQLLNWLNTAGLDLPNLTEATVRSALESNPPRIVREVLEARQQLARSSLSKMDAVDLAACSDGRVKGCYLYHGADTGRWAGRIFQPQNLPRPSIPDHEIPLCRGIARSGDVDMLRWGYDDPMGALTSLIRSTVAAPEGRMFAVADLASIESVMAAWFAGSGYLLDLFRQGRDPYKDFATKLYNVDYEAVTKKQRSFSKPCVLGAQYGMSAGGLQKYGQAFGMDMDIADCRKQLQVWKDFYSDIPATWNRIMEACISACKRHGQAFDAAKCTMRHDGYFLVVTLPSRRSLYYRDAKVSAGRFGVEIVYQDKHKGPIRTFGARMFENIVQAGARDVLARGMMNAEAAGLEIFGHVHDEIMVETDKESDLAVLIQAMTTPSEWCADAPIRAAGYVATYYKKD